MHANTQALGRNHSTADSVTLISFGDCYRVDIRWNDGAHVYAIYDSKDEATAHANRLGFFA